MFIELPIKPGVVKDNTDLLSEGRWIDADKVRFRSVGGRSQPEVIGGFEDLTEDRFAGKARALHAWERLDGVRQLAIATNSHVYVYSAGLLWDITPIRVAATLADPLATTAGDATVTVSHAGHGLADGAVAYLHSAAAVGGLALGVSGSLAADSLQTSAGAKSVVVAAPGHGLANGDRLSLSGATAVGGVDASALNTTHTVRTVDADTLLLTTATAATEDATGGGTPGYTGLTAHAVTVVDADSYRITASSPAGATATGGGTVTYAYAINPGRENTTAQAGYSTGTYSTGAYSLPSGESDLRARVWVLSNFGEDLIANHRDSVLYRWQTVASQRMTAIAASDAPLRSRSHLVTAERFLMALGTEDATTSSFDPMQVAWAQIEGGYATGDWTPESTNSAGDLRLAEGSRIVAGASMPLITLVWTDTALYALQYIPEIDTVYRPSLLGTGCGLIGPNAYARVADSGQVFWLAASREFMLWQGGTPITVDCPVRDFLFDGLGELQEDLIYAGVNDQYNEVWWFYPDATNENARYVAFNHVELHWTVGTFGITAWQPRGVETYPVAAHADGSLKLHEKGDSDNGAGFAAYVESGLTDLQEGERHLLVRRFVPDLQAVSGAVRLTLKHRLWPQGSVRETVVGTADASTETLDFRVTACQIAARFDWIAAPTDRRTARPAAVRRPADRPDPLVPAAVTGLIDGLSPWERAVPLLARAVARQDTHALEDVRAAVAAGRAQLWCGRDSALVTEIQRHPRRKVCRIWLAAGRLGELVDDMLPAVEAWAAGRGCDGVEVVGRPGWARVLPGYTQPHTILEKRL